MSVYALAVGDGNQESRGALLMAMLGQPPLLGGLRFRDAWVERGQDGEPVVAIYTRNGGGNRECFCLVNYGVECSALAPGDCDECVACRAAGAPTHPLYLRDQDDEFDSTYATFYFRAPDQFKEVLAEVAGDPVDTDARWADAIAALRGES